jgi:UDP-N-acetylmuramoyl-tripeptide--D-alanyl-D-alanine ligase
MELSRAWVARVTDGRIDGRTIGEGAGETDPVGSGVAFDSRALRPGEVFVALRAERDGHDFVADAFARGAPFAIVERASDDGPVVVVPDVPDALFALARAGRDRLHAHVIGITGSVGKTSTKDLTAAAVGAGLRTHAAPASFNNEIGVPVTVLGAPESTEALVVEMGARFAGNITALCALVDPEIGVITNIGVNHAEHLGGPEGVARAKGELLDALPPGGLAVLDADTAAGPELRARSAAPIVTVGTGADADVRIRDVVVDDTLRVRFGLETPWGSGTVALAVRGAHQASNAAQAATVALHLGVPFEQVVDALAHARASAWRMEVVDAPGGVTVINDAYNASPVATVAALDALAAVPGARRRVAVLGEMRELGALSESEHARVGGAVAAAGVDVLVAVGAATEPLVAAAERAAGRPLTVHRVPDAAAARSVVIELAAPGDVVLVKASRAVGLEVVADALTGTGAAA